MPENNIHGTGLIYSGVGVIIRGPSGAGKSLLALSLLEFAQLSGETATLVSDDQLFISVQDQKLIMETPHSISGKIELFGHGILFRDFVSPVQIDLVIDISEKNERMPTPSQMTVRILSKELVRCPVANTQIIGLTHQRMIALEAIKSVQSQKGSFGE